MTAADLVFDVPGDPEPAKPWRLEDCTADWQRGLLLAGVFCPDAERIVLAVVSGEPRSKARPRVGKYGNVYTPGKVEERTTGNELRREFPKPVDGNLAVFCIFYRSSRSRVDVDNMLKHVLDSATGIVWQDDSQVTAVAGIVELDRSNPRTVVVVAPHRSTMEREPILRTCGSCKRQFVVRKTGEKENQRFCSVECANVARRVPSRACAGCGKPTTKQSELCRSCWLDRRYNRNDNKEKR